VIDSYLLRSEITPAFSCGARSAFKLKEIGYLRKMLPRRQLQGFVGRGMIGKPLVIEIKVTPPPTSITADLENSDHPHTFKDRRCLANSFAACLL